MTKHKPFDMRRRGFTEVEALHLAPLKVQPVAPSFLRLVLVASVVVLLIHLFVVPLLPLPEARAAEPMKTNADYCLEWQSGEWRVALENRDDVAVLCAEYL